MEKNKVYLTSEQIVEILVIGDQDVGSIEEMGRQAYALCQQQRSKGQRALILDNLLLIGAVPPEGRSKVVELIKSTEYDRLAMVGNGSLIRLGANLMLQATGKGSKVKYFDSRDKAIEWLKAS